MGSKEIVLFGGLVGSGMAILLCLAGAVYYAHLLGHCRRHAERELITTVFGAMFAAWGFTVAIIFPTSWDWQAVRVIPSVVLLGLIGREIWGWWRRGLAA